MLQAARNEYPSYPYPLAAMPRCACRHAQVRMSCRWLLMPRCWLLMPLPACGHAQVRICVYAYMRICVYAHTYMPYANMHGAPWVMSRRPARSMPAPTWVARLLPSVLQSGAPWRGYGEARLGYAWLSLWRGYGEAVARLWRG